MKTTMTAIALATAGFMLSAQPGIAGPKHCPPGHVMQGKCSPGQGSAKFDRRDHDRRDYEDYRSRSDIDDELDRAYEEGYRQGRDDGFRVGQRLDRDRYRILDRDIYYDRYNRRLDDGYYYAESDGQRLLVDAATGVILDLLNR